MIPGLEMLACQDLAVPMEVMEHVVRVESSFNPYAIGVVGARLARQPRSLGEAVATAAQLEREGYNFSLGLAQVNRHNLAAQGLDSYEKAFAACLNLAAGARILADCHARAGGDWDKAFSCYYSGNFVRGFRDGYVQKVRRSLETAASAIPLAGRRPDAPSAAAAASLRRRRSTGTDAGTTAGGGATTGATETSEAAGAAPPVAGPASGLPFVPRVTGPRPQPDRSPSGPEPGPDTAFVF